MAFLPPAATLTILGPGSDAERQRLRRLTSELGLAARVRFESVEHAEVADAYRSHDCLIFPSEWPEPFGLVPLEAMACGTPVVATGVGGSSEFLGDGRNCLLFVPGDASELAEAVRRLADEAGLRRTLVEGGRITAAQFDLDVTAEAFEQCHVAAAAGRLDELELMRHPAPPSSTRPSLTAHGGGGGVVANVLARRPPFAGALLVFGAAPSQGGPSGPHGGTVSLAGSLSELQGTGAEATSVLAVVADGEHLPFRDHAFAVVVCHDILEKKGDARSVVIEVARVSEPSGSVLFIAANRRSAAILRMRLRYWWRGWRRGPEAFFTSSEDHRTYTWSELERVIAPAFEVRDRITIGWDGSWTRRAASHLLIGPLRGMDRTVVVEASPR
jgi:SAM-dependent methyltransferase